MIHKLTYRRYIMKRQAKTIGILELQRRFSTEYKAHKWFEKVRWRGKPVCPQCRSSDKIVPRKDKRHKHAYCCNNCQPQYTFTVKTDTVMHASKLPLVKWAIVCYLILTARKGISSLQLSKELDITQKSAWFMLQRVREGCKQGDFKLSGSVEIDETYLGGKEQNKHESKRLKVGGGSGGKQILLGMRKRGGKTKAVLISNTTKQLLHRLIRNITVPGSTIYTDDNPSYIGARRRHKTVNHSEEQYVIDMVHTNGIESVWALIKRGLTGTYHKVSKKHLARYIDEFVFRLNEGRCEVDTMDRMTALVGGFSGKRLRYKDLIKSKTCFAEGAAI